MANEITTDVRVAELDRQIRSMYKEMNSNHVSLLIDLYMLIYRYTKRNKTYIDALDLLSVIERNMKKMGGSSIPKYESPERHKPGCEAIDDHHVTDGITFKDCTCGLVKKNA